MLENGFLISINSFLSSLYSVQVTRPHEICFVLFVLKLLLSVSRSALVIEEGSENCMFFAAKKTGMPLMVSLFLVIHFMLYCFLHHLLGCKNTFLTDG